MVQQWGQVAGRKNPELNYFSPPLPQPDWFSRCYCRRDKIFLASEAAIVLRWLHCVGKVSKGPRAVEDLLPEKQQRKNRSKEEFSIRRWGLSLFPPQTSLKSSSFVSQPEPYYKTSLILCSPFSLPEWPPTFFSLSHRAAIPSAAVSILLSQSSWMQQHSPLLVQANSNVWLLRGHAV